MQCGAKLSVTCAECGAPVPPAARFCPACGARLSGGATVPEQAVASFSASAPTATPVAERRLVTVLFADLVGFTTLAEGRDPEETRELLTRYFDLAREVVDRYGGTVEKFIGDAVMAVWGAPIAHEDDAERAVRAALELVAAVRTLGPDIEARAGVLTGEAAVTLGATGQGMVAGDLVNTASRLQSAAAPGTVLVGEATQRAASARDRLRAGRRAGSSRARPPRSPPGAPCASSPSAAAAAAPRRSRRPSSAATTSCACSRTSSTPPAASGRARLVSVTGPAGIGKTRLAWEFLKYLDGLVEPVWWHEGRCPAYGEGISFWALGEMVRWRCGLLETDDEATTRAKVAATLREHVPRRGRAPLDRAGAPGPPGRRRRNGRVGRAVRGLAHVLRAARRRGHRRRWSSRTSTTPTPACIDFVDHLLEWSRSVPIYVSPSRGPSSSRGAPTGAPAAQLHLARPRAAARAGHARAPRRARAGPARDAAATPSSPGPTGSRSTPSRPSGCSSPTAGSRSRRGLRARSATSPDLAVPETLTALIAARLDGLDPADRALVHDAAVLGQSFTARRARCGLGHRPRPSSAPHLRALVRRELLALEADPRSPERGQYAFVQALDPRGRLQHARARDRKARHLAAARYFESLGTDELAGALAGHYLAAYQNAAEGPEADALAAQARIALAAAADRAAALGSYEQAVAFLEQALSVTSDPPRSGAPRTGGRGPGESRPLRRRRPALARGNRDLSPLNRRSTRRPARPRRAARPQLRLGFPLQPEGGAGAPRGRRRRVRRSRAGVPRGPRTSGRAGADAVMLASDDPWARSRWRILPCRRRSAWSSGSHWWPRRSFCAKGFSLLTTRPHARRAGRATNRDRAFGDPRPSSHRRFAERQGRPPGVDGPCASRRSPWRWAEAGLAEARRLGLRSSAIIFAGKPWRVFSSSTGDWEEALEDARNRPRGQPRRPRLAGIPAQAGEVVVRAWRGEDITESLAQVKSLTASAAPRRGPANRYPGGFSRPESFWPGRGQASRSAGRCTGRPARVSSLNAPDGHGAQQPARRSGCEIRLQWRRTLPRWTPPESTAHSSPSGARRCWPPSRPSRAARRRRATISHADARRGLLDRGIVFEAALVAIDMATVLGPEDADAIAAAADAGPVLERLRARPFLDRLDATLAGTSESAPRV